MEPIRMTITDELDLHTFRPAEVPDLLDDYLNECLRLEIYRVRIIHGKGSGTLAKRVQTILERHPLVLSWRPAPAEAGGWGATLAELEPAGGERGPNGA
jgi:dsDNA-specific endonuclease/ATPase MutS2